MQAPSMFVMTLVLVGALSVPPTAASPIKPQSSWDNEALASSFEDEAADNELELVADLLQLDGMTWRGYDQTRRSPAPFINSDDVLSLVKTVLKKVVFGYKRSASAAAVVPKTTQTRGKVFGGMSPQRKLALSRAMRQILSTLQEHLAWRETHLQEEVANAPGSRSSRTNARRVGSGRNDVDNTFRPYDPSMPEKALAQRGMPGRDGQGRPISGFDEHGGLGPTRLEIG